MGELIDVSSGVDVFDLVESLKIAESPLSVETYRETEHEGLAAVVELVAAVLVTRGTRRPVAGAEERPDPSGVVEGAQVARSGRSGCRLDGRRC